VVQVAQDLGDDLGVMVVGEHVRSVARAHSSRCIQVSRSSQDVEQVRQVRLGQGWLGKNQRVGTRRTKAGIRRTARSPAVRIGATER
jgi:hypothetical protein